MFVALAIRDILILRVILVSAQALFIVYSSITANYVVLVWNALFLLINMFQVIVLLRRRRPVPVDDALRDIHEQVFDELTPQEFVFFWRIGREVKYFEGPVVEEGTIQDEVMLILSGTAAVMKGDKEIASLQRGNFVAEMSFLSGDPASANVVCRDPIVAKTWSKGNLKNIKNLNFTLWSKVQNALSKELVGKVRATSDKLHS